MPRQEDTPTNDPRLMGPATDPYHPSEDGERMAGQAGETARETASTVQDTATRYAEQGRERVTSQLGDQKMRLSQSLGSVSEAIRSAGQRLQEDEQTGAARIVEQGADRLDHITQFLDERDVNELISEVETFARERPAIFLGGAFGLGLLAARFLKSSGQEARSS